MILGKFKNFFEHHLFIFSYLLFPHWHQFNSVAQWCQTLRSHGLQNSRLPCPSPTPRACPNPCPSSQQCHPTISSLVVPFSSCLLSFPASRSFPMSQFFASGGQSVGIISHFCLMCMYVYSVTQSCPTLCDRLDCSQPDSSVHGITQARILEWVAMPSSRASFQPRDQTCIFHVFCIAGIFFTC